MTRDEFQVAMRRLIVATRASLKMTMRDFAAHLDLSASAISRIESGERMPTLDATLAFARATGVSLPHLATLIDGEARHPGMHSAGVSPVAGSPMARYSGE